MKDIRHLRDVQYGQPQDYPTIDVAVDRQRSGQLGVTMSQIGRSLLAARSSSRFFVPNYWADPKTGVGYQVQVEIPQSTMNSVEEVKRIPDGDRVVVRGTDELRAGAHVDATEESTGKPENNTNK